MNYIETIGPESDQGRLRSANLKEADPTFKWFFIRAFYTIIKACSGIRFESVEIRGIIL